MVGHLWGIYGRRICGSVYGTHICRVFIVVWLQSVHDRPICGFFILIIYVGYLW